MFLQLNDLLQAKLDARKCQGNLRTLKYTSGLVDFTSNDYLGLAKDVYPQDENATGSTGSRLLTGHSQKIENLERIIASFHEADEALVFNTGYAANLGLISSLLTEEATIIYDLHCHASILDGIKLGKGTSFPFFHNDIRHLEERLKKYVSHKPLFVVVESIYSMDGSLASLREIGALCEQYNAGLIVDEAHAIGVFGEKGRGRISAEGLEPKVFARVLAFGKAFGAFGGAVIGSKLLKDYLINFSRPFCYSTALPPVVVDSIASAYEKMKQSDAPRQKLSELIEYFHLLAQQYNLPISFAPSPIQSIIIPGNDRVKLASQKLAEKGFDVRPILSPTVKRGNEMLRLILHSFNTPHEIKNLVITLKDIL